LEGQPLPPEELEPIASALLSLLSEIHAQGLLLRDLTPQNVLLGSEGELKLIDWELAYRWKDKEAPFPGYTPGYASPQQVRGGIPTPSDDLYSFGCLVFFLATGRDPVFRGDPQTRPRRALQVVEILSSLPSRWREAIGWCLQNDPHDRPPSALALETFLREGKGGS
jgi:serine/threonine protein kinase